MFEGPEKARKKNKITLSGQTRKTKRKRQSDGAQISFFCFFNFSLLLNKRKTRKHVCYVRARREEEGARLTLQQVAEKDQVTTVDLWPIFLSRD
jgi:hypothetical protein